LSLSGSWDVAFGGSVFHRFFPDNDMPKKRLLSPDEMVKLVNLMKEVFDQIHG
jgi:hypothetical protein